jgi:hypothetical protein
MLGTTCEGMGIWAYALLLRLHDEQRAHSKQPEGV